MCVCRGGYLNQQLGTGGGWGVRGNGGCWGEPIANICWLAGGGEMDCSGTVSERQFHHHLHGPVHQVFLEHWGDLLVKGREEEEKTRVADGYTRFHLAKSVWDLKRPVIARGR